MRGFFSADNIIFKSISRVGDMFMLSFFWFVTGIFIFTIGASTTALIDVSIKILRKRDGSIVKDFFVSFKSNFKQATIIWMIMLVTGAVLYADVYYWSDKSGTMAMIIGALSAGLCVLYVALLIYVFAVQAVFANNIVSTIRTAFLMAVRHFSTTFTLMLCLFGITYLCWILPVIAFVMLVFGVGAFAIIFSVRYLTIFRIYNDTLNPDENEEIN